MAGCRFEGKDYSEGSVICSDGQRLKCRGGEWSEIGPCNLNLDQIPLIEEKERKEFGGDALNTTPQSSAMSTVYISAHTMRKDNRFCYFRGAATPGHMCSNYDLVKSYIIPIGDLVSIGKPEQCNPQFGWYYQEVQFRHPI